MKKLWIVYDKKQYGVNSWFANKLCGYLSSSFDSSVVFREDIEEGGKLPDIAVVRTIDPVFSRKLEERGVIAVNSADVSEKCNDKRLTYELAGRAGVPFSDYRDVTDDKEDLPENFYPVVLKTVSGHGGKGVALCGTPGELAKTKKLFEGEKMIAQKLAGDGKTGKDLRVYVLGGRILKAVLRVSENDFRSNFSLGGKALHRDLSRDEEVTVKKIISELGPSDFVGVDFLLTESGLLFNEIEDVVGTRMLYSVYGIDAAKLFADYITDRYAFGGKDDDH